ncbi:FAD-dependent oxidoreductase [Microbulbifer taiwanensis]|uniref:FAD-dependent oxidoreductase n=1 Tax=Microbulbifer taiwanensis TaxID=986746 RepID=UPI0036244623
MNAELLRAQVAAPLRIDSADAIDWHGETDIAVVGYGAAGACAALEAAEQGADVRVLDRLDGGGASALSGGVVYAGGGTEFQRRAGENDSVENMLEYLKRETGGVVSEQTLRRFCSDSIANLDWLQHCGVPFDGTAYDKKTSYPPEGYFLYYSGNELCAPYRDLAQPVRRGHRVRGEHFTGRVLFDCLHRAVQGRGNIRVENHCEVSRLILDRRGHVLGLEYLQAPRNRAVRKLMRILNRFANRFVVLEPRIGSAVRRLVHWLRKRGSIQRLRVSRGVILAAGGFIFQRRLLQQYAPAYINIRPLGEDCNGSGIALGASVGGTVEHMHRISAWRFLPRRTVC